MNTYFEVGVKYVKIDENGREKRVNEMYLLDAVSFTEAESRIYKQFKSSMSDEFIVTKIAKTKISEIIPNTIEGKWFKCKIAYISTDEITGKEHKTNQLILVQSETVDDADKCIKEAMSELAIRFEIVSISESNILEVFPYVEEIQDSANENKKLTDPIVASITKTGESVFVYIEDYGTYFCPEHACSYSSDELKFLTSE